MKKKKEIHYKVATIERKEKRKERKKKNRRK